MALFLARLMCMWFYTSILHIWFSMSFMVEPVGGMVVRHGWTISNIDGDEPVFEHFMHGVDVLVPLTQTTTHIGHARQK